MVTALSPEMVVRPRFESFDPMVHDEAAVLYELRSVQLGEGRVGTTIEPSEATYQEAVNAPWYYMVKVA